MYVCRVIIKEKDHEFERESSGDMEEYERGEGEDK